MWTYVATIVLFFAAFFLIRELLKWFKGNGYDTIADTLSPLEKKMAETKDEMYTNGKAAVMAAFTAMTPILVNKLINEGPMQLLDKVLGQENMSFRNSNGYAYVITDDKLHPFQIHADIAAVADKLAAGCDTKEAKARAIFNWFQKNVPYDDEQLKRIKRKLKTTYRHSAETWKDKTGVCGEQAYLLLVMFRHVGIKSKWVRVFIDNEGENVRHACVYAELDNRNILCDPAYYKFEINHKKFKPLTDKEAYERFQQMR